MNVPLSRRVFLRKAGVATAALLAPTHFLVAESLTKRTATKPSFPQAWLNPPREFSLAPFWFWNDELSEPELERQLADFQAHGVHAFVIHPRAGLPRSIGWLGERMIHFMRFAIERAKVSSVT